MYYKNSLICFFISKNLWSTLGCHTHVNVVFSPDVSLSLLSTFLHAHSFFWSAVSVMSKTAGEWNYCFCICICCFLLLSLEPRCCFHDADVDVAARRRRRVLLPSDLYVLTVFPLRFHAAAALCCCCSCCLINCLQLFVTLFVVAAFVAAIAGAV